MKKQTKLAPLKEIAQNQSQSEKPQKQERKKKAHYLENKGQKKFF